MKAIFIDSTNKTVTEIDVPNKNTLQAWYKILGVSMVEVATYITDHDSILVDEEGLLSLTSDTKFFSYKGGHQPFAGNGLVVGVDEEGESVSCDATTDQIKAKVQFHSLREVQLMVHKG